MSARLQPKARCPKRVGPEGKFGPLCRRLDGHDGACLPAATGQPLLRMLRQRREARHA